MDNQQRLEHIGPADEREFQIFMWVRLHGRKACQQNNKVTGKKNKPESFTARLHRLAARLEFDCLIDLLVWYELEARGWKNASKWQVALDPRWRRAYEKHPKAVKHLDDMLELTRQNVKDRAMQVARTNKVVYETVLRHVTRMAEDVNVVYSLDWMIFLHALYKELQARPELARQSTTTT